MAITDIPPPTPAPDPPPVYHAWYVGADKRYCTKCGFAQDATPNTHPILWTPDAPACTGGEPSSAADIREGEEAPQGAAVAAAKAPPPPVTPPPTKVVPKTATPLRYKR